MAITVQGLFSEKSLAVIGVLLALVFGSVGVYTEFIREDAPVLRFETLTDAGVLDVKEQVTDLQVSYKGVDIEKAGKALRVSVVRIANVGRDSITVGDYDPKIPFGITVTKGELVRAEIITASNEYLRSSLTVTATGPTAAITAVIWDPKDSATLKLLILHDRNQSPKLNPIGKIARVSKFEVIDETTDQSEVKEFLTRAFGGGAWTHVARFVAYSLVFVLALLLLVVVGDWVRERKAEKRMRQFLDAFLKRLSPQQRAAADPIIAFVRKYDVDTFRAAARLLVDRDALRKAFEVSQGAQPLPHRFLFPIDIDSTHPAFAGQQRHLLRLLTDAGLAVADKTRVDVLPEIADVAKAFLLFTPGRRRKGFGPAEAQHAHD